MSEQARLMDRLFNDPTRKLINISITRGDKPCSVEELCGALNKSMDASDRRKAAGDFGDGPVRTGRPRVNLRELLKLEASGDQDLPKVHRAPPVVGS